MIAWVPWKSGPHDPRQPQGRGVILRPEEIHATVKYLRLCREARALGWPTTGPILAEYSITRDPEWLVDMAVNRRAGWPDDPSGVRGSCVPVNGKYPKRAEGDVLSGCRRLAWDLAHRIYTREVSVRWLPRQVRERVAHRLHGPDDY